MVLNFLVQNLRKMNGTYCSNIFVLYFFQFLLYLVDFLLIVIYFCSKSSSLKKFGKGIWRFFCYGACILILLTILTILGSTVSDMMFTNGDDSTRRFSYPFKYLFWKELLAPISKKVYCVKECPH